MNTSIMYYINIYFIGKKCKLIAFCIFFLAKKTEQAENLFLEKGVRVSL